MSPVWFIYHDGNPLYKDMAEKCAESVIEAKAGHPLVMQIARIKGADLFGECVGQLYPDFTQWIDTNPVIFIDADHLVHKPIDHLFTDYDFDIAAPWRGCIINEVGEQGYLCSNVMFNCRRPNLSRRLFFEWGWRIYNIEHFQHNEKTFDAVLNANGWRNGCYYDQATLNAMIKAPGTKNSPKSMRVYGYNGARILPLSRSLYDAKPGNENEVFITHYKGSGKRKSKS